MRYPNGYGSVYKLSGKRRKPFIVRKTIGYDENTGKQIYATIGYYETRKEANLALAEYNSNPYNLDVGKMTFSEIYDKWLSDFQTDDMNASTLKNYTNAYQHCSSLYDMRMLEIRTFHLQAVIDAADSYNKQHRIKILFNHLYVWLIKNDAVKKNYALSCEVTASREQGETRTRFSNSEILKLWKYADGSKSVQIILILIYSGLRINELLNLKKCDCNLKEQYFNVRESKTTSGIRIVPIADAVLPFWQSFYNESLCDYVITNANGEYMSYDNFKKRYFSEAKETLNFNHTIHETRHTCISLLKVAEVNDTIIKKIVGHKSKMDLTERVYTHYEIEELLEAINKIEVKGLIKTFHSA